MLAKCFRTSRSAWSAARSPPLSPAPCAGELRQTRARPKAVLKPTHSRRWRDCQRPPACAKHLGLRRPFCLCGGPTTAAFVRAIGSRSHKTPRPREKRQMAVHLTHLCFQPVNIRPTRFLVRIPKAFRLKALGYAVGATQGDGHQWTAIPTGLRRSGVVGNRATTPVGVAETTHSHPRVGAGRQHRCWALRLNPFGIAMPVTDRSRSLTVHSLIGKSEMS